MVIAGLLFSSIANVSREFSQVCIVCLRTARGLCEFSRYGASDLYTIAIGGRTSHDHLCGTDSWTAHHKPKQMHLRLALIDHGSLGQLWLASLSMQQPHALHEALHLKQ